MKQSQRVRRKFFIKKSFNSIKIHSGLQSWREAVQRSVTSSQLSMALYTLEQCVAWDKSIMKAVRELLIDFLWVI
jgi:hypothetical protein